MDSLPFADIVGIDFECQNSPRLDIASCPATSFTHGGLQVDDVTGSWICPVCYAEVGRDADEEDTLFDDDEDESDAFDNDEVFVSEGDRTITFTDEEQLRITRDNSIERMVSRLGPVVPKFAMYMDRNRYAIVDQLRMFEEQGDPTFATGTNVAPKLLAITIHESKTPLNDSQMKLAGASPSRVRLILNALTTLSANSSDRSPMVEKIYYVGNGLGISDAVLSVIVEQLSEAGNLPNRERDETTKAAAWIYIRAKSAGLRVTKKALKDIPGVRKNSLDRAIDSYHETLRNRNKAAESV